MRPDEPLTAGIDSGPGPGAPLWQPRDDDPVANEVRALYRQFPYPGIREILEDLNG